jgi:hypothetical protein
MADLINGEQHQTVAYSSCRVIFVRWFISETALCSIADENVSWVLLRFCEQSGAPMDRGPHKAPSHNRLEVVKIAGSHIEYNFR